MRVWIAVCLLVCTTGRTALAQTASGGSVRGYVKDEQDAILPGVRLTAVSPDAPGTPSAASDQTGYYRLLDLPPGTYKIVAELDGFAQWVREGIVVRAGLNVSVPIVMKVGTINEVVTVKSDTPMLETRNAVTAMNVSGDFQRELPLSARRSWSDFLSLTPGVASNNAIGSGTTNFYVNGAHFGSHVLQLDGADVGSPGLSSNSYVIMSSDVLQDVQVKTAAIDAAAPLGQGAVINMVTKSGTNDLKGSGLISYQNRDWHGNNDPGGTTSAFSVAQPELTLGGPIRRDRIWFFGAYRHSTLDAGISRTDTQLSGLKAILPQFTPFNNDTGGTQTLWKVTAQLTPNHRLQALHQYGEDSMWMLTSLDTVKSRRITFGGHAASASLSSTWGGSVTSRIGFSFGNQTNYDSLSIPDKPGRPVYQNVLLSSGRLTGTGQLAVLDNYSAGLSQDAYARKITATADVTYFKDGWLGSHEFQTGAYIQPRRRSDFILHFVNGGFATEDMVLKDPSSPAGGIVPFHRLVYQQDTFTNRSINSRDYAGYIQDAWKPSTRLTLGVGLRIDAIHRHDRVLNLDLQDTAAIGPRLGAAYLVTADGTNIIRGSWSRLHEAVSSGAGLTVASSFPGFADSYDLNRDGVFETTLITPPSTPALSSQAVDVDHYRQPHASEFTLGYTRQLPRQVAFDTSVVYREYRDRQANIEVNGIYDGGVFKGYRDLAFNNIFRLTSNTYNWPVYTAFEARVAKRSDDLQLIASYTRQFRHIAGTWQANDPALFIQPDAFPNDRGIGRLLDGITQNSLSGADMTFSDQWKDHVFRVAASYRAPWHVLASSSYTFQSGPWSGPIVTRRAAGDPQFGPPTVTLSNGRAVSNPLATVIRFAFAARGDGQLRLASAHTWNLRVARRFQIQQVAVEPALDVLNLSNNDAFFAFLGGANQTYNANYGQGSSRQPPREVQMSVRVLF
jgi:hypothetical protein